MTRSETLADALPKEIERVQTIIPFYRDPELNGSGGDRSADDGVRYSDSAWCYDVGRCGRYAPSIRAIERMG